MISFDNFKIIIQQNNTKKLNWLNKYRNKKIKNIKPINYYVKTDVNKFDIIEYKYGKLNSDLYDSLQLTISLEPKSFCVGSFNPINHTNNKVGSLTWSNKLIPSRISNLLQLGERRLLPCYWSQ